MDTEKFEEKFELQPKEKNGMITLSNAVRVTDPCYNMDTWCAGTIENVLPGDFDCFSQKADTGDWGIRIANIEVRHKDYPDVEPTEWISDIDVGVDSGQCGLFDNLYFSSLCEDTVEKENFYEEVCDLTYEEKMIDNPNYVSFEESKYYSSDFEFLKNRSLSDIYSDYKVLCELKDSLEKDRDDLSNRNDLSKSAITKKLKDFPLYNKFIKRHLDYMHDLCSEKRIMDCSFEANTIDDKGFVSSSGDGDGSYTCFVGRNKDGQVVSVKIDYYPDYELLEEMQAKNQTEQEVDEEIEK